MLRCTETMRSLFQPTTQLLLSRSLAILFLGAEYVHCQETDSAQYTSAASKLISQFIPASYFSVLASSIAPAASAAGITFAPTDVTSIIYSALEANNQPGWFSSAVPTAFVTRIAALESDLSALRTQIKSSTGTVVTNSGSPKSSVSSASSGAGTGTGIGTDSLITSSPSSTSTNALSGTSTSNSTSGSSSKSKSTNTLAIGLGVGLGLFALLCLIVGAVLWFWMRKRLRSLENERSAHGGRDPVVQELGGGKVRAELEGKGREDGRPLHELEGARGVEMG